MIALDSGQAQRFSRDCREPSKVTPTQRAAMPEFASPGLSRVSANHRHSQIFLGPTPRAAAPGSTPGLPRRSLRLYVGLPSNYLNGNIWLSASYPASTLLGRFRPPARRFRPPGRITRVVTRNCLIPLALWTIVQEISSTRSKIRPVFRVLQGGRCPLCSLW
jgi:hypothetical protein